MKTMGQLLKKRLLKRRRWLMNGKSSDLFLWETLIGKRLLLTALAVIGVLEAWFAEAAIKSESNLYACQMVKFNKFGLKELHNIMTK